MTFERNKRARTPSFLRVLSRSPVNSNVAGFFAPAVYFILES